jgi:hypothetical protein
MESQSPQKIVCPTCCAVLDAGDSFCRRCGASTVVAAGLVEERDAGVPSSHSPCPPSPQLPPLPSSPPPGATPPAAGQTPWLENVWVVLAMLFLALGPLALPMLWRSRQFSLTWKVILTVLVLLVVVLIVAVLWYVFNQLLAPLESILA